MSSRFNNPKTAIIKSPTATLGDLAGNRNSVKYQKDLVASPSVLSEGRALLTSRMDMKGLTDHSTAREYGEVQIPYGSHALSSER